MRILILPLACALISSCSHASETSLMSTDFQSPLSPVHKRIQSRATLDEPLNQQKLIDSIAQDCLESDDWKENLRVLGIFRPLDSKDLFRATQDTDLYPNSVEKFEAFETLYRRLKNKLDVVEVQIEMKKAEAEGLKRIRPLENLSKTAESSSLSSQN